MVNFPQINIGIFFSFFSAKENKYCPGIKANQTDLLSELIKTKNGFYANFINEVLKQKDEKLQKALKAEILPAYTIACTFNSVRNQSDIKNFTGLINIDIDGQSNEHVKDWAKLRDYIFEKDSRIVAAWLSVRGNGISIIVKGDNSQHKNVFLSIEKYFKSEFGLTIDPSAKDVGRLRFVSYDPDIKITDTFDKIIPFEPFIQPPPKKQKPLPSSPIVKIDKLHSILISRCVKIITSASDGEKHHACLKSGRLLGGYIAGLDLPEDMALDALDTAISSKPNVSNLDAAFKTIRSGVDMGKKTPITDPDNLNMDWFLLPYSNPISNVIGAVNGHTTTTPVKDGPKLIETFWAVDIAPNGIPKISFSRLKFIDWLISKGFGLLRINHEKVILIRIVDNIVDYTDIVEIKKTTLHYIKSLPDKFDGINKNMLIEFILKGSNVYFSIGILDFLDQTTLNIIKDTKDAIVLFFNDTALKITSDAITTIPYSSLKGHIWKSHIIDRPFSIVQSPKSDFDTFIKNISSTPPVDPVHFNTESALKAEIENMKEIASTRYEAFKNTIGYMISTHKNRSKPITPILCDMKISDTPSGGSGKGIFARAIGHIRNMVTFDGRNPKLLDGDFAFQRVNPDTQVIFFDDVLNNFNFERLFSISTEGLSIGKKNKQELYVEFENSPKSIVSTNYTVKGDSISAERRRTDVEFFNYYDTGKTPESDFGKKLYDDWSDSEWNHFFNLIATYAQSFLKSGISNPKSVNLKVKNLMAEASPEFYNYFYDLYIKSPQYDKIYKKDLYDAFIADSGINHNYFPSAKMWRAIPKICDHFNIPFIKDRESSNKRSAYVQFIEPSPNNSFNISPSNIHPSDNQNPSDFPDF